MPRGNRGNMVKTSICLRRRWCLQFQICNEHDGLKEKMLIKG